MTSTFPGDMPEPHILERTMPLTSAERMLFASCKSPASAAHGRGSVLALVDMVFEHYVDAEACRMSHDAPALTAA
jgi:hypothetical protein